MSFTTQRQTHPAGDSVQPTRKRCLLANPGRLPHENEKRCLTGVLSIMREAKNPSADTVNKRPVSLDESGER